MSDMQLFWDALIFRGPFTFVRVGMISLGGPVYTSNVFFFKNTRVTFFGHLGGPPKARGPPPTGGFGVR